MTPALCVVVKRPALPPLQRAPGRQKPAFSARRSRREHGGPKALRLSAAGIRRTITDAAEDGRTPQSPAKAGLPDNTT